MNSARGGAFFLIIFILDCTGAAAATGLFGVATTGAYPPAYFFFKRRVAIPFNLFMSNFGLAAGYC